MVRCYYCGVSLREGVKTRIAYVKEYPNGTDISRYPEPGYKRVYLCSGCM